MTNSEQIDRRNLLKTASVLMMAPSAGILALSPLSAAAAIDISHKIKIAGDLRMFTQRMALSAAFVMLNIEKEHYLDVLRDEYGEFNADIMALRNGDPAFSMAPEDNTLVLEAIDTVAFGWTFLGPSLKDVIDTGAIDDAHFTAIERVNTQVMTLTDSLIHRILFEYKDGIQIDLAYQIDVVGTLRMLSQKMIKEAILIALEFEAEDHHEMLVGSMQLFRFDLDKLAGNMLHNEHTLPVMTGDLAEHLVMAEHCWAKLQPILKKLDETHAVEDSEVLELAHEADRMLEVFDAMNGVLIKQAEEI